MRPIIVATVNPAAAILLIIDPERFVFGANFGEQSFRAFHRHQGVVVTMGNQSWAGDVLGDTRHGEIFESLTRFFVANSAEQPLHRRLQVMTEIVEIVENAVTAAPGDESFDAPVECGYTRRVITGHADAD